MTHAGTFALGGSAQSKQGGLWPAIALTLALVLAMIGAVWFASNADLVGGTAAKPVADRTPYAGAAALSTDEYLNGILDRAHATPYAGAAAALPVSSTSGTFHPGNDQLMAPAERDRVGGP